MQAVDRTPAIREALARARASHEIVGLAEAETRPQLKLLGTVASGAGGAPRETQRDVTFGSGLVPWIPNAFVGLVLSWRFFDAVADARVERARALEEVARADVRVLRNDRVAAVEQARVGVEVARDTLPSLEALKRAAVRNQAQAEARFRSGLGTSIEMADAIALLADAETQLALGRFEVTRTQARLTRAIAEGR
jgi:outer membrane protein TolC